MMPSSSYSTQSDRPAGLMERLAAYMPTLTLPDPASGPTHLTGTVLRIEIEGFEALAESLMKTGREGGDVLTRVLNGYYSPLLKVIEERGGDVLNFDGNGLNAFFPHSSRAIEAGTALIETAQHFPSVQTLEGRYSVRLRAGVGSGELSIASLGSDIAGRSLIFSGPALELARQVALATPWQGVGGQNQDRATDDPARLPVPSFGNEDPLSVFNRLSPYLPRQLAQHLKTTPATIGGEFRRVVNIFVQLSGLHLNQPADLAALQTYYNQVQQVCAGLDGRIHAVLPLPTEGLICLYLTFGVLLSNNDDAEHALRTALALRDLPTPSGHLPTIGIASGNVFTGSVGNERRQSYIVLGKVVNMSSQFADAARNGDGPGTVLVDRFTRERVGLAFLFGEDLVLNLPGWPMPVKTSRVLAVRPAIVSLATLLRERPTSTQPLTERGLMLEEALHGHRQITLVQEKAQAAALAQHWLKQGGAGAVGVCMLNATHVPYLAWTGLLGGLIGLNDGDSRTEKAAKLSQVVAHFAPDFTPLTGWLNQLLGLAQEEPGFRQRISGSQQPQFATMILELLAGMAQAQPTMLIFRDIQWSDEAGMVLLEQVVRELGKSALLFCLTVSTSDAGTDNRIAALLGMAD